MYVVHPNLGVTSTKRCNMGATFISLESYNLQQKSCHHFLLNLTVNLTGSHLGSISPELNLTRFQIEYFTSASLSSQEVTTTVYMKMYTYSNKFPICSQRLAISILNINNPLKLKHRRGLSSTTQRNVRMQFPQVGNLILDNEHTIQCAKGARSKSRVSFILDMLGSNSIKLIFKHTNRAYGI